MSEEKVPSRFDSKKVGIFVAIFAAVVLAAGSIGHFSGVGFFSYRLFLYGQGDLYLLNMSKEPLYVEIPGHERVEVPPENAQIVEFVGGEMEAKVFNADSKLLDTHKLDARNSHAFIKLTQESCLAVVELDPFYQGQKKQDILFKALLKEDTRVWIPESKNVVWPRKPFPSRLSSEDGPGLWVELVGCPLLEDPTFLDAYLAVRLEERIAKAMGRKDESQGQKSE